MLNGGKTEELFAAFDHSNQWTKSPWSFEFEINLK